MEVLRAEGRRNRCSPERAFHSLSSCLNKKVQITSNSFLSVHLSWTLCAHFRPYLSLCGWCVNKHEISNEISMLSISMKTAKRSQADNELQKFNEHLWKVGHACLRVGGRVVGQERLTLFQSFPPMPIHTGQGFHYSEIWVWFLSPPTFPCQNTQHTGSNTARICETAQCSNCAGRTRKQWVQRVSRLGSLWSGRSAGKHHSPTCGPPNLSWKRKEYPFFSPRRPPAFPFLTWGRGVSETDKVMVFTPR